jgi:hypothetical protein
VYVLEVALVVADLARWMEHIALAPAEECNDAVIDLRRARVLPLLELDDDRLRASALVVSRQHAVESARGERKLQLDDDALIVEVRELDGVGHRPEGRLPRPHLALRRLIAEVREERL